MSPRLTPRTDDRGVTAVEYALIVFLVGIAMLMGVVLMTRSFSAAFAASADSAAGPTYTPPQTTPPPAPSNDCESDDEDHEDDGDCDDEGDTGHVVLAKPGAPAAPTAIITASAKGSIDLSWSAPANDGGTAIKGYALQKSTDGANWSDITTDTKSTGRTYSATSLGDGKSYYFRVAAVNAMGTGPYSAASSKTTTPSTPGAPRNISASSPNRGQLTVTWDIPASDGGSAIDEYTVEIDNRGGNSSCANNFVMDDSAVVSSGTSTTFTGLSGDKFCVQVSAHNAVGYGNPAENGTFAVLAPAKPGSPTGLTASGGSGVVTLRWSAPTDNGGAAITSYRIERASVSIGTSTCPSSSSNDWDRLISSTGSAAATYVVDDGSAENGWACYRVAAINSVGTGSSSGSAGPAKKN